MSRLFDTHAAGLQRLAVVTVVLLAGLATLFWHRDLPLLPDHRNNDLPLPFHWDSQSYRQIASGDHADVLSPFSKRVLYPYLGAAIAKVTGARLGAVFVALNLIAFGVLAYCLAATLAALNCRPWLAAVVLLTPTPLESLLTGYMPDLFHMALVALFFLLLLKEKEGPALLVMMAAFLTRESTLLLCLVAALVAWIRGRRRFALGSVLVLVLGIVVTSAFARLGKPNYHHLPDFVYLALKVPYNFLTNCLGICVWTDSFHWMGEPLWKIQLPGFLHVGQNQQIGISLDWHFPLKTLILLLSVFGIGPLFLRRWIKQRRQLPPFPMAVQLAFWYGTICFVLGPSLGNLVGRLSMYGWPLFWIGLPFYIARHFPATRPWESAWLLGSFCFVAWWPWLFGWSKDTNLPLCALGLLAYVPVALLLSAISRREGLKVN